MTLLTCTPYMINTHRLLVTGHRVPYTPELAKEKEHQDQWRKLKRIGIIMGVVCSVLLLGWMLIKRIKDYYLSKRRMTIGVKLKHIDKVDSYRVSLYDSKGKKPVYRNGKPLMLNGNISTLFIFENLPGGLYQLNIENGPNIKVGLKGIKQERPLLYTKKTVGPKVEQDHWQIQLLEQ